MPKKVYANPYLFIKLVKGKIKLYDYLNHENFTVSLDFVERLIKLQGKKSYQENKKLDPSLLKNNLISFEPYKQEKWEWDWDAHIFHFSTRDNTYAQYTSLEEFWEKRSLMNLFLSGQKILLHFYRQVC